MDTLLVTGDSLRIKTSRRLPNLNKENLLECINFDRLDLKTDLGPFRIKDAYDRFVLSLPSEIPFLVWLLENPNSVLALPGKIDLKGHDYLHLLLNRGKSRFDEAFVIGFTMGNDKRLRSHHSQIFKFCAHFLYPEPFQFNVNHLQSYELGLAFGQRLAIQNINQFNFDTVQDLSIQALRDCFGISRKDLLNLWGAEQAWILAYPH